MIHHLDIFGLALTLIEAGAACGHLLMARWQRTQKSLALVTDNC